MDVSFGEAGRMPVDDSRRDAMLRAAAASWGEEAARTLAEHLEPHGERLANQADVRAVMASIDAMDDRIESEFVRMEERIDGRFVRMEERIDDRFARVDGQFVRVDERMAELEARIDLKLSTVSSDLSTTFERGIRSAVSQQTRTLVFSQLGALVVLSGIVIGMT